MSARRCFQLARQGGTLDITARHAWAAIGTTNVNLALNDTSAFRLWIAEVGIGGADRRGRVDRGWTLSVFAGLLRADTASGWTAGLSVLRTWARW